MRAGAKCSRGPRKPKLRINYAILTELKRALRSAQRKDCGVDAVHQEAMALYLDTWVVKRLEGAIAEITRPPKGRLR